MSGSRTEYMKENGNTTVCMERAKLPGLMADVMKASTNMIRNMDSVHSCGLMEENISDTGKTENSMEEESTTYPVDRKRSVSGWKVKR